MPEAFDPYHKWLGIPPEEQPANHYRLLGIKPFESDLDLVESAADQRMAHLRTHQTGKQGALSQKLLNEVAAAKICLMNPVKKAAYDQRLRPQLEAKAPAGGQGPAAGFDVDGLLGEPAVETAALHRPSSVARRDGIPRAWLLAGAGAAAAALAVIAAVWALSGPGNAPEAAARVAAPPQPAVNPPPKLPATPNPPAKPNLPETPKASAAAKPSDTPRLTDLLAKINPAPPVEVPQPAAVQPAAVQPAAVQPAAVQPPQQPQAGPRPPPAPG